MELTVLLLALGFAISLLSGFLGIGGGILMAPALLYLPPILGVGAFDMKQVTGLTITQTLFACLWGTVRHDKDRCVNRRLVGWMGVTIAISALAASLLSGGVPSGTLMLVFAGLAILAAVLMLVPREDGEETPDGNAFGFNVPIAVLLALIVGSLGGMVGQGGSFLLIPLMLYFLHLPTKVVIGSNLGVVCFSAAAGFVGKLATGQIPFLPAAVLVAGVLPGAHVGSALSQRTKPRWLRTGLAVVVVLAALGMTSDVLIRR